MKCNKYQLYWEGTIPEREFEDHIRTCEQCREAFALDGLIEQETHRLPSPESAPWLWPRIEAVLRGEKEKSPTSPLVRMLTAIASPRQHLVYKIAALLLVTIGVSYLLFMRPVRPGPEPRNLLTSSALTRVEEVEREYEQAIAELEKLTLPLVANADTDLLLLYRDKLETIDAQIDRCKEALANNRADAHIRRYLLAAYRDKRETLTELLELTRG